MFQTNLPPVPNGTACPYCHTVIAPYDKDRQQAYNLWYHGSCHVRAIQQTQVGVMQEWRGSNAAQVPLPQVQVRAGR